jgi:hypothetical protein
VIHSGIDAILVQHSAIVIRLAAEVWWWTISESPARLVILANLLPRLVRAQKQEQLWERLSDRHHRKMRRLTHGPMRSSHWPTIALQGS